MTSGKAPGGPLLIEALAEVVRDYSLLYANTPDANARLHFETLVAAIEPSVIEAVGAKMAPKWLDALRGAVMGRKHEIEAGGASRA
jgi:hypothetical protein